jgi:cysteine desulfurase/selenocysteine lyase
MIDIHSIKQQFPIFNRKINNKSLVYFDNAASSQKPRVVLDAIQNYYTEFNANVHRGIHTLSQEATELMEESRNSVQKFINAKKNHEIIFTKGTTEAINLVAHGIQDWIKKDDEIIISHLEHHSNIVPWQLLAERKQAKIKVIPIDENGDLVIEEYRKLLSEKTKIVTVNYISNALGVVNPIQEIIESAHRLGSLVLIDAAQAVPHTSIDVQQLDCDFLAFSGHKMYAPTGVGILYGKEELLEKMIPYQGGGEMIKEVTFEKSTFQELPFKFEAGTPNIEANIVLKTAIDFIHSIGYDVIKTHENNLLNELTRQLSEFEELTIYAKNAKNRAGAISFNLNLDGVSSSDVGFILDKQGIAVRTGHHCTQPIMQHFGISGTVRASFGVYNTFEDIEILIEGIKKTIKMLR